VYARKVFEEEICTRRGISMKKLVTCICAFCLLVGGVAWSEEQQLGVYVGAKIGAGIARHGGTTFGMDAATMQYGGYTYSWDSHRVDMGHNNDIVIGGGASLGYDFSKRFNFPLRLEFDYTVLAKAKDTTNKTATFEVFVDGNPMSEQSNIDVHTSIGLQTMMLNTWIDIPTGTKLTPYFGGGIGAAFVRHKSIAVENPGTPGEERIHAGKSFRNFAWNAGAGVAYNINDRWTMDLGYRYVNAGSHKMHYAGEGSIMSTRQSKISSHNIMVGIRRTF
jgi:opacity protein-like surface antigen